MFRGDYSGVSALSGAHPIWSDSRDLDVFLCAGTGTATTPPAVCTGAEPNGLIANDQQIYTRRTPGFLTVAPAIPAAGPSRGPGRRAVWYPGAPTPRHTRNQLTLASLKAARSRRPSRPPRPLSPAVGAWHYGLGAL